MSQYIDTILYPPVDKFDLIVFQAYKRCRIIKQEQEDFKFISATFAKQGLELAISEKPAVILLDLGLPDLDGLKVIQQLRQWTSVPILVLSARDQERDKILALDLGADDYLTKPFSVLELTARIRVALRHQENKERDTPVFETGELRIDFIQRRVFLNNKEVSLSPIQYQLLTVLARHAGMVVTHKQLLKEVWGEQHAEETDYVRIYIHQLRHKLEENPAQPKYLRSEPGVGYRLQHKE